MDILKIEQELEAIKNRITYLEEEIKKEKLRQTSQSGSICTMEKPEKESKLKERKLSEANIGKYALPVAATFLIMIGICVMAFMAWNLLSDWFKAMVVFGMAAGIFGIGYLFGRNERMFTFRYIMYSVGLSISYVGILLMHMTWYLIPMPVSLLLIVGWSMSGLFLSKSYSIGIFYHIIEIGVVITSFVIRIQMDNTISSIVSILITMGMYWFIYEKYRRQNDNGHFMFGVYFSVMITVLLQGLSGFAEINGYTWFIELILTGLIFLFAYKKEQILLSNDTKQNQGAVIVSAILAIWIPSILFFSSDYHTIRSISIIIFLLLMLKDKYGRNIMIFFVYLPMVLSSIYLSNHYELTFSGLSILAVGLVYLFNRMEERMDILHMITNILCSVFIFLFSLLACFSYMKGFYISAIILLASNMISIFFLYKWKESYAAITTTFGCLLFNIGCIGIGIGNINGNIDLSLGISIVAEFIFFVILSTLEKRKYTGKKHIVLHIFSWFLALNFSFMYITRENLTLNIVLAIVIILNTCYSVYLSDIWKNCRKSIDILYSFFITMNIMVLIHNTMIWDYAILLTLILMGLSSGFILIGFRIKRKGIRLYGLTVLMLSVLKMILVDTTGNNPIVKVIAMIVGGMICLGISYLYNKLEKRLSSEDVEY